MIDYEHPSEEFLRSIDIHTLLPQQEPFVMVGTLTYFERTRIKTELRIPEDNIFVNDGYFSAAGIIENMAQTCAARLGYINKYILLKGIQLGFIGALRDMEVVSLPKVGETIVTEVVIREEVFGMLLADATVMCDNRLIAKTEMKIAEREGE